MSLVFCSLLGLRLALTSGVQKLVFFATRLWPVLLQQLFLAPMVGAQPPVLGVVTAPSDWVPGEVLVRFRAEVGTARRRALVSRYSAHRLRDLRTESGLALLQLSPEESVEKLVERLNQDPDVEYAQPNYIYRASALPNDPLVDQQWAVKNSGQTVTFTQVIEPEKPNPGVPGSDMRLEAAWDKQTDCKGVRVAILDSGISGAHEDFQDSLWDGGAAFPNHGYDFVDGDDNPEDLNGHGTHVAGIIGAVGNNGTGTTGVCWAADLMIVRVLDRLGMGNSAIATQAMDFAVQHGAKVINLSLGGGRGGDFAFAEAVSRAEASGAVVIVSSGNEGADNDKPETPTYPCNFPNANLLCVTALDQAYQLPEFANYGKRNVDLAAPGVNIVSGWAGTIEQVIEDFSQTWNETNPEGQGWSQKKIGGKSALVNPENWDGKSVKYSNSRDDIIFKQFDIEGDSATLFLGASVQVEPGKDFFSIGISPTGENPFGPGGKLLQQISESREGFGLGIFDVTDCHSSACSIGFRLQTDQAGVDFGVAIKLLILDQLFLNGTSYNLQAGTSMAAPYVSGLAALVWSAHPEYTAADVIRAILEGGRSIPGLETKTVTGKAADALGALEWRKP